MWLEEQILSKFKIFTLPLWDVSLRPMYSVLCVLGQYLLICGREAAFNTSMLLCCCVCVRLCLLFLWVDQWKPLMRLYIFRRIFQRFGVKFCSRNRMIARFPFSHKLFGSRFSVTLSRGTSVQAIDFHSRHLASRLIRWLTCWWL